MGRGTLLDSHKKKKRLKQRQRQIYWRVLLGSPLNKGKGRKKNWEGEVGLWYSLREALCWPHGNLKIKRGSPKLWQVGQRDQIFYTSPLHDKLLWGGYSLNAAKAILKRAESWETSAHRLPRNWRNKFFNCKRDLDGAALHLLQWLFPASVFLFLLSSICIYLLPILVILQTQSCKSQLTCDLEKSCSHFTHSRTFSEELTVIVTLGCEPPLDQTCNLHYFIRKSQ